MYSGVPTWTPDPVRRGLGTYSAAHAKNTVTTDVLAVRNDSGAEERFRMKFGRNTPLEERRQVIETNVAAEGAGAPAPSLLPEGPERP